MVSRHNISTLGLAVELITNSEILGSGPLLCTSVDVLKMFYFEYINNKHKKLY